MKHFLLLSGASLFVLLLLLAATPLVTQAAVVAISGLHMAAVSGANQPSVTHFPCGVRTVYFDCTVDTPSPPAPTALRFLSTQRETATPWPHGRW